MSIEGVTNNAEKQIHLIRCKLKDAADAIEPVADALAQLKASNTKLEAQLAGLTSQLAQNQPAAAAPAEPAQDDTPVELP